MNRYLPESDTSGLGQQQHAAGGPSPAGLVFWHDRWVWLIYYIQRCSEFPFIKVRLLVNHQPHSNNRFCLVICVSGGGFNNFVVHLLVSRKAPRFFISYKFKTTSHIKSTSLRSQGIGQASTPIACRTSPRWCPAWPLLNEVNANAPDQGCLNFFHMWICLALILNLKACLRWIWYRACLNSEFESLLFTNKERNIAIRLQYMTNCSCNWGKPCSPV